MSRRYKLSPNPIEGRGAPGDRLELAWDGHRVLVCRAGKDVRIFSADFREWSKSFPQVCHAMTKLDCKSVVIDGFLCALDTRAHPSFDALREYVKRPAPGARVVFAAWDVLEIDDGDLRAHPLGERAGKLAALLAKCKEPLVLSQALDGSPRALLESLDSMGVRGLVARAPNATYETAASCIGADAPIEWNRSLSAPPKVTNADKVLYPRDGITKTDIARYYDEIAEPLLRVMRDRPVVCQRWPDGIDDFTWYQHRMPPRAPDYLRAVWIEGNRRVVIETREGLLWMVNQAALTFHGWSSRVATLTNPDWVILDLDPGENTKWETVIDVALALRKLLEMLELPSVPKTSGQKGLHILVPIAKGHTAAQTHELAYRMAILVQRLYPNEVSLEAQTETRKGRLYLDHLQNFMGKSLVLPYSLRAANGAPASTPLEWSEVTKKLDPKVFGLRNLRARLDAKGDLAAPIAEGTAQLAKAITRLKQ
ncbi:MAG TPA: non-homologous end-joining DNA ligase [Polyangiaceae bacterium]|nr:non-homologous end-joining DNA ligase [Polyangiaceae bacterium]